MYEVFQKDDVECIIHVVESLTEAIDLVKFYRENGWTQSYFFRMEN